MESRRSATDTLLKLSQGWAEYIRTTFARKSCSCDDPRSLILCSRKATRERSVPDIQPVLIGQNYLIFPLTEHDREELYIAANDPFLWEQHPEKNRWKRSVFDFYFDALVAAPGSVVFVCEKDIRVVGCSRIYQAPNALDEWSIGSTFIERALWGGGANLELKTLMLNHLFKTEERVWFHIDRDNIRSQKATAKLGAVASGECYADIIGTGQQAHYLNFVLHRETWKRNQRTTTCREEPQQSL